MSKILLFVVAATLVLAPLPAAAKEIPPGSLRACNHSRCAAVTDPKIARAFQEFFYGSRRVARAAAPPVGTPAFELRLTDWAIALAGSPRLDRVRVYGIYCERFRRGRWYQLPARAAAELRRLTANMTPLRVTKRVPRSC